MRAISDPRALLRDLQRSDGPAFAREPLATLSPADQLLFEHFGKGPAVTPGFECIHHAFEAHAAADPDAIACEHLGAQITYGELDQQANALAALLVHHG